MQVFPHHSWWSAKWFHMYFMSTPAQWGRTVYLRGIWRFTEWQAVPWCPDLNRTIWLWDHHAISHLLNLHTSQGQSAAQGSLDRITNSLSKVTFWEDFLSKIRFLKKRHSSFRNDLFYKTNIFQTYDQGTPVHLLDKNTGNDYCPQKGKLCHHHP